MGGTARAKQLKKAAREAKKNGEEFDFFASKKKKGVKK